MDLCVKKFEELPDKPDWGVIESFVGFGNINAPVVFVGMEEGLADPLYLGNDLRCRSVFDQVMDVKVGHSKLGLGPELFAKKPRAQPTWRGIADIMLHFEGDVPVDKKERAIARRRYRTTMLGNKIGESLLVDVFPYPHQNRKQWLYAGLSRFKTREEYEAALVDDRLALLREAIEAHKREAVICYGHELWDVYKLLFPKVTDWRKRDHCLCANWKGANVTLCNHFTWRGLNQDWQLDELASIVFRGQNGGR